MTINFSDFGLTSAIDPTDPTKVTADAQLRVSAQADSLGLIANYTQATNANKMLWSRADNKENRVLQSELQTTTNAWDNAGAIIETSNIFDSEGIGLRFVKENSATSEHRVDSNASALWNVVSGTTYILTLRLKSANRGVRLRPRTGFPANSRYIDLQTGLIVGTSTGVTVTPKPDNVWEISYQIIASSTSSSAFFSYYLTNPSDGTTDNYTGDGTSGFYMGAVQFREASTDPTYLPTTDHPQYAGVNGRRWLVLNGAQGMDSTSLSSDIYLNNAKLTYLAGMAFNLAATNYLFASTSLYWAIKTGAGGFIGLNYDGNDDNTPLVAATINTPFLLRYRQSGGLLYLAIDTGAGFGAEQSVATGNTTTMSTVLRLSTTTNGFYGKLGGIFTANTGIAKPNFENLLREYYFARSQIQYDPITCQLVARRP